MAIVVISISLLFFLGHGLRYIFIKTKVPDLLILVILGYVLGPVLGIVKIDDFGKVGPFLTTLALIVILYEGGLGLRAKELLTSSLPALGLSIVGFIIISSLTTLAVITFAFKPWETAMLVGLAVGSTSSAIVIPMVQYLSISNRTKTILSLESAFTDVLTIVVFLVIVDAVAIGQFSMKKVLVGIGPQTLQAIMYGIFAGLIWAFLNKRFSQLTNIKFSGEAWALLTYGLIELTGLNGAMGVLALGFTLSNLDLLPQWLSPLLSQKPVGRFDQIILGELTFLLKTFFFIYLGMLIEFSDWKIVLLAILLTVLIFVQRFGTVKILMKPKKYSRLDAMMIMAMGPRGLACAVLATIPAQRGIANGLWIQNTLFAIIPISILCTAALVLSTEQEKFRKKIEKFFDEYPDKIPGNDDDTEVSKIKGKSTSDSGSEHSDNETSNISKNDESKNQDIQ